MQTNTHAQGQSHSIQLETNFFTAPSHMQHASALRQASTYKHRQKDHTQKVEIQVKAYHIEHKNQ